MKVICASLLCILSSVFYSPSVYSDPGIIIEAKGKVAINEGGKTIPAQSGSQFNDGAVIDVAAGASAVLMFSNGATKKLSGGEKFTAEKPPPGQSSGAPLIKGLAMAYNDATSKRKGPTVHGMVKAVPGQKGPAAGNQRLDAERSKMMKEDLAKIDALGLAKDGRTLMQAQVYYKYGQNQKMIDILLPLYRSQNPPAEMVKKLLALGYEKTGNSAEAAKYR